ncbi:hypothetical protein Glove_203g43 [Diversispora epigaea]|uniref:Uncharacterized protein n=1 Tax=Diversispora epigaea TaxID=1348612 RepID=A0A397IU25_9GLOM|nr:hypothetical protein Glove_203g43 [Diversispora epigaea]
MKLRWLETCRTNLRNNTVSNIQQDQQYNYYRNLENDSWSQLIITLILLYCGNDILGYTTPKETSNNSSRRLMGQIIIVTFGGAFNTQKLSIIQWLVCVSLGFLSIPVGIILRLIPIRNHPQTQFLIQDLFAGKSLDGVVVSKNTNKKDTAVGHSEPSDQENISVATNQQMKNLGFLSIPVGIILRLIPIRNHPQTQFLIQDLFAGKSLDGVVVSKNTNKKDTAVGHSEPSDQENISVATNQQMKK